MHQGCHLLRRRLGVLPTKAEEESMLLELYVAIIGQGVVDGLRGSEAGGVDSLYLIEIRHFTLIACKRP